MFIANENFPKPSINLLREKGFVVLSIQELYAGISDQEVINMAISTNKIILTFDSDYGEIIFRYNISSPPSVIFFREKGTSPEQAGLTLITLLENSTFNFQSSFTVIERDSIRLRKY